MDLDEVLQWDAHLLLYGAGVVDVAADVEEFSPAVPGTSKAGKPVTASSRKQEIKLCKCEIQINANQMKCEIQ